MIRNLWAFVLGLSLLAACQQTGGFPSEGDSAFAPSGAPAFEEAVDGLTVGHRLMAAGEYELAIKAYLRAAGTQGATVDVLSALGSANLRLGRLGQAEKLLRNAVKVDETFVPAWNNLGVVLMEKGETGEARQVFMTAYALDSGESDDIRDNLRLAIAKTENPEYVDAQDEYNFALVRRGAGEYLLLSTP